MQAIPSDYVPDEQERKAFPDGKYKASGIVWFKLDDRQNPVLVSQKDGRMVGRCYFKVANHEDNPPASLELSEMALLVKAFGGDLTALPEIPTLDKPGKVSAYMMAVEKAIEDANKEIPIEVANGWVDNGSIAGMDVTGYSYFSFDSIVPSKTGEIKPSEGQWGPYFLTRWKVLAGEGGGPSPFTGALFTDLINYAVDVAGGRPDWKRTPTGGYTAAAVCLCKVMTLTAPVMFENDYTAKDPYNLLPEWADAAERRKQVLKGIRNKNEKGKLRTDWSSVEPVYNFGVSPRVESPQAEVPRLTPFSHNVAVSSMPPGEDDAKARLILKRLLIMLTGAEAFVGDTFDTNAEGKRTAIAYLGPLKAAKIVPHGMIKNMTWEHVQAILENIKVPDEHDVALTNLRHELAAVGIGADDGSSDF